MCPCVRVPFIPPFVLSLICFCTPHTSIFLFLCVERYRGTEKDSETHTCSLRNTHSTESPLLHSRIHSPMSRQTPDPCPGILPPTEPCSGAPPRLALAYQGLTHFSWKGLRAPQPGDRDELSVQNMITTQTLRGGGLERWASHLGGILWHLSIPHPVPCLGPRIGVSYHTGEPGFAINSPRRVTGKLTLGKLGSIYLMELLRGLMIEHLPQRLAHSRCQTKVALAATEKDLPELPKSAQANCLACSL